MFKGFAEYITCMLGGDCPKDKDNKTDKVTIENESDETVVEEEKDVDEVNSQSSTPRMFTFITNKEKTDECANCADCCADEGKEEKTDDE